MSGYLLNFSIYTLAMLGIIFTALFVFKFATSSGNFSKKASFLNIEDSLKLSARKTIYVLKAGDERFLVAADMDRTSLISKLAEGNNSAKRTDNSAELSSDNGITSIDEFTSVIDMKKAKQHQSDKSPIMREIARKLNF